jgi:hypothetical protein
MGGGAFRNVDAEGGNQLADLVSLLSKINPGPMLGIVMKSQVAGARIGDETPQK